MQPTEKSQNAERRDGVAAKVRRCRLEVLLLPLLLASSYAYAQAPPCMAADLLVSFHVHDDPGNVERITLLTLNTSGRDCMLTISYPPSFVPLKQPGGPQVELCQRCANRLSGGEEPEKLPLALPAGAFAHQTFRYRTAGSSDTTACVPIGWMSATANADMKHPLLLVSKSLLKPVCSAVDVVGYLPGPGDGVTPSLEPPPGEPQLALTADRSTYYADEWFALRTDPEPAATERKRILLLSERGPEGDTRLDEVQAFGPLRLAGTNLVPSSDGERAEIDSGARSRWSGLGPHTFQLFQVDGSSATGEMSFLRSRPLTVLIADAATIARTWGVTQQGVRVDLTLDKTQFRLGEDIVAHIAAQVVESNEPVYGQPNLLGGAFFHRITGSFHLSITDADGPLENSDRRANLDNFSGGSSGPSVCPPALEVGKVIPLDRSLRDVGLLPTRPGTYHLSVTWSPYHSRFASCPSTYPDPSLELPFVTVTSNTITVTVVGNPPPSALPPVPEYTAWRAHFRLIDTTFGPLTALLDLASGLEWLRPSITSDYNMPVTEKSLTALMGPVRELGGWRFATLDEVKTFMAHFTGAANGSSADPAVARKLIRLLGGKLLDKPDPQTGWLDNRLTVKIAGLTPAPADRSPEGVLSTCPTCGPGFWVHIAFIREAIKDGRTSVSILSDDRTSFRTTNVDDGWVVYEGGGVRYPGFFLVRKTAAP